MKTIATIGTAQPLSVPNQPTATALSQDVIIAAIGALAGFLIRQYSTRYIEKDREENAMNATLVNNLIACQRDAQAQLIEASAAFNKVHVEYIVALRELKAEIAQLGEKLSQS